MKKLKTNKIRDSGQNAKKSLTTRIQMIFLTTLKKINMNNIKIEVPGLQEIDKKINKILGVIEELKDPLPEFLPAQKMAELLEVKTQTLSKHANKGHFKKYRLEDRRVYYKPSEVYEYIERNNDKKRDDEK